MRIDAGADHLYASQRPQATAPNHPVVPQMNTTRQTDFTSMTRQEMRDWVNAQIRSGKMSLDDSHPFVTMTVKIPVGGGPAPAENDNTRYDFMQEVRNGIQGARSRHDETSLKMLESAMQIMQRHQGQIIGVDVRV